jgi:dolichol-phosphate mannosyltransferase
MESRSRQVLCVVCPFYNEAEVARAFYECLKGELQKLPSLRHRLLFVDDGSSDETLDELNRIAAADPAVEVYSLSRNFGHQVALTAGLDAARGDAVVMMDSDLQHPPALIPELVEQWRRGADVVSAVRRRTADETWLKRLTSRGFYKFLNFLSDTPIPEGAADFCLLSRRAHRALRAMPERHRFLRGMVSWMGFERVFVEYDAPARAAGRSKYNLRRMLKLASNAVFSFSAAPLQTTSRVGLLAMSTGLLYLAYIVGRFLLYHDLVPGWSSVVCSIVILGGLQLIFIGLIGEYLARIFEEVKGRPLYLFKQRPRRRRPRPAAETAAPRRESPLEVRFGPAVRSVDGHAPALLQLSRGMADRAESRLADAGARGATPRDTTDRGPNDRDTT